jgi:indolepyruvate ferredoxin oxidoreductase alpha subunit
MTDPVLDRLAGAEAGTRAVLQGNLAFALGVVRAGIRVADGYPGTPSTEVIDKGLGLLQHRIRVGWSVNEANAVAVGYGATMAGADAVVTLKVPGLFQAADVVATVSQVTEPRGALVLYIASDFVPTSTQYVIDPRYFLRSCGIPILEPRNHQEMVEAPALAVALGRRHATMVAVLANGLLCHSEGVVSLPPARPAPVPDSRRDYRAFMNLPEIARRSYDTLCANRLPALREWAETWPGDRIEWADRSLGVVVHGFADAFLREVLGDLPVRPSLLSLGSTFPLPPRRVREFADGLRGRILVLGDGLRFVQEALLALGIPAEGKDEFDSRTEWDPHAVARRLGAPERPAIVRARLDPVPRPATICAGCSYRAFGLAVQRLRKKRAIVASFGDIGCNTLLYYLDAIDTCACMGAADGQRQGVVLVDPDLAGRTISVLGDSTECHSGLDSTRNAVFRNLPGVKVVLDNRITAMTGGQPAPTSEHNLAGEATRFDLDAALAGEGARVEVVDAFDFKAVLAALKGALKRASEGEFTVLVVRGECVRQVQAGRKRPCLALDRDKCRRCDLCYVCPGIEPDEDGYPRFTHLCTGCAGHPPVCAQLCNHGALVARSEGERQRPASPPPPLSGPLPEPRDGTLPRALRLAVRGVGGQGTLFLGRVLASLALRLGYPNVVKGETHGMAQLGGAVMSTFACGDVHSPVLGPASADAVVALETAEVLRPGFLDLLVPGGTVLLNRLRILPQGVGPDGYPSLDRIREVLAPYRVVEFDALAEARAIGDASGRTVNVITLGLLSTIPPFDAIDAGHWQAALAEVSPPGPGRDGNLAAFERGRLSGSGSRV